MTLKEREKIANLNNHSCEIYQIVNLELCLTISLCIRTNIPPSTASWSSYSSIYSRMNNKGQDTHNDQCRM